MSTKDIRYVINADEAPFSAAIRRVDAGLRGMDRGIGSAISGIAASVARISTLLGSVGALLTSGSFVTGVRNAIALQDEMSKGAQRAGLTTEAWSSLAYAAKLADVPVEELEKSVAKLSATLVNGQQGQREAVELFRRLRLDPKSMRDADELLQALAARFELMPDGVQKTALAVDIFGERIGPRLVPFLNQGLEGIQKLREEARQLGVVVGTETGQRAEQFQDNMTKIAAAASGAANAMAGRLLPGLLVGTDAFVKAAKEGGVFHAIVQANLATLAKFFGYDDAGKLESRLKTLRDEAAEVSGQIEKLMRVARLNPTLKINGLEPLRAQLQGINEEILKVSVAIARANAGNPEAGGGRGFVNPEQVRVGFVPGAKPQPAGPKAATQQAPDSYMAYYRELLAEDERARTVLSQGREYGKQDEIDFWKFILGSVEVTAKDRVTILRRTSQLEAEIVRGSMRDRVQVDRESVASAEQLALAQLEVERATAASLFDTHEISAEQIVALEEQYAQRRFDIRTAAAQQRVAIAENDPETNPAELARLKNELLMIEQQYQAARASLATQATAEQRALWDGLWSDMQGGFSRVLANFLQGTATLGQTVRGLFQALGTAIINTLAQMAAKWLVQQVLQRIVAKVTAAQQIIGNAAVAGSAGVASMAAAPFPLNLSAPAFGASMAAASLSFLGAVPAAEKGWDIPAGINPLTQLHEREMVLPREQADAVRDMASGGAAVPVELHFHSADAQGVRRLLMENSHALADAIRYAQRNFHLK